MTAIQLRREQQADIATAAQMLAESGYFQTNQAQAAVAIVAGMEIGIGPVEALRSFHFANGGVQPSAALLARLIRRHPRYDYRVVSLDDDVCELAFLDFDEDPREWHRSRFTIEDARRADLLRKTRSGEDTSWHKHPRNMLFSRAMTNGVAWYAPDVIDALAPDLTTDVAVQVDPEGSSVWRGTDGDPVLSPGEESAVPTPVAASSKPGSPIAYGEGAGRDSLPGEVPYVSPATLPGGDGSAVSDGGFAAASEPQGDPDGPASSFATGAGVDDNPSGSPPSSSGGAVSETAATRGTAEGGPLTGSDEAASPGSSEALPSDAVEPGPGGSDSAVDGTAAAPSGLDVTRPAPAAGDGVDPPAVDGAAAVPPSDEPDLRPAMWDDLERECLERNVSRIKILAQTAGRTVKLTAKPEDFSVAELEKAIAAVTEATVSA